MTTSGIRTRHGGDGLGPDLLSIAGDCFEIELGARDWPVAAIAGDVAQVLVSVGRPDEDALPRDVDYAPAVAWSVVVDLAADVGFHALDLARADRRQLA
jgi:hypothetical protein